MTVPHPSGRLTLIFDADDTLWENNRYFEQVIDDYLAWLAHPTLDRAEVRATLDDIERARAAANGYGSVAFLRNLHDCFEQLNRRAATDDERASIDALATPLAWAGVELMPAIADTLQVLAGRHDLALLTKGDREEQQRKITASGLAGHFGVIDIVAEKDPSTYRRLITERGLDAARTWMIGNSPRSDIRAARAAGLRAVFIPNPHTWVLEQEELDADDDGTLVLTEFRQLLDHF